MDADEKKWIQQWRAASAGLAEQRAAELASLTDAQAAEFSEWLLSLAGPLGDSEGYSGLVEQQKYFQRAYGEKVRPKV